MTNECYINDTDAYTTYGITLMGDSVSSLRTLPPMKSYVENVSRLEQGKHIIVNNPKYESREVTLTFGILGKNANDFEQKRKALLSILSSGEIKLRIPSISAEVYHLVYTKNTSYAQNIAHTFCKMACKFTEADPTNRS